MKSIITVDPIRSKKIHYLVAIVFFCFFETSCISNKRAINTDKEKFDPYELSVLKIDYEKCTVIKHFACFTVRQTLKKYMISLFFNKEYFIVNYEEEISSLTIDTGYVKFKYYSPLCSTYEKPPIISRMEYMHFVISALKEDSFKKAWDSILGY